MRSRCAVAVPEAHPEPVDVVDPTRYRSPRLVCCSAPTVPRHEELKELGALGNLGARSRRNAEDVA
jgi:hypothetical protein